MSGDGIDHSFDALNEASEYLNGQFGLLAKIVETSLGMHGVYSKELIIKRLADNDDALKKCRHAFSDQAKRFKLIESKNFELEESIKLIRKELAAMRPQLTQDQTSALAGEREDYRESDTESRNLTKENDE